MNTTRESVPSREESVKLYEAIRSGELDTDDLTTGELAAVIEYLEEMLSWN